jgi:hypothetical protein
MSTDLFATSQVLWRGGIEMELHSHIEIRGQILLVTAEGDAAFDAVLRIFKLVFDSAKEKGINKILVNTLAVNGKLTTEERYRLAVELAEYLKQRNMKPRVAIVGVPPTMDGFGVLVAQNRDVTTQAFDTERAALNWLNIWPS